MRRQLRALISVVEFLLCLPESKHLRRPRHLLTLALATATVAIQLLQDIHYGDHRQRAVRRGSSRDWAAEGVAMLGVRAVIARSFELINRSNLIGMGVLPITISGAYARSIFGLGPNDQVIVDAQIVTPRCPIEIEVRQLEGGSAQLRGTAAVETGLEADTLAAGGMIPCILSRVRPAADRQRELPRENHSVGSLSASIS